MNCWPECEKTLNLAKKDTIGGIAEKMKATIQSIRSVVQDTTQYRMENVRVQLNEKEGLRITQNDLHGVKASFDKYTNGVVETERDTREHLKI
jgi:hypothetical protein